MANDSAAEAADPANDPKLEIELLKNEDLHVCMSVDRVDGGIAVGVLARPGVFGNVAAIHGVANGGRHVLFYQAKPEAAVEGFVRYDVMVPAAILKDTLSFEVQNKKGELSSAFTAGRRKIKLPPKWQFSPYHLNLTYGATAKGKSKPDHRVRAFVRTISMVDDLLTIDASLFIEGSSDGAPKEAAIVISREGMQVYTASFPVTTAKKIFRIPVAMHKSYTLADAVHGKIELPILAVFDDPAVYDVTVKFGDDETGIRPYNRYYFEKPSVHVVNGDMGSHVIRHFADPTSGNIRISFQ